MPSTAVGLVGATKTCAVAQSPHANKQRVRKTTLIKMRANDQEGPRRALEAVRRPMECDKAPGHARKLRGVERRIMRGTTSSSPTDSEAQVTPRRGQKRPGALGVGNRDDKDDHALADVRLSTGHAGCDVSDNGGGGGGGGGGCSGSDSGGGDDGSGGGDGGGGGVRVEVGMEFAL